MIRVKVLESLLSETDFQQVQQILNLKKENHWRARPDHQRRFTYSGFLKCGDCGNLIYTHANKRHDWYVCKSRTWPERLSRQSKAIAPCMNPYMRREKMESLIDTILSERMTDRDFLERLASEYVARSKSGQSQKDLLKIQRMRKELDAKRQRLLDAYFDNVVDRSELNRRLEKLKVEQRFYDEKLRDFPSTNNEISAEELARSFEVFQEWKCLSRIDRRRLLQAIVPEIYIANYRVTKLAWLIPEPDRNEIIHMDRGSSRRPA